MSEARSRIDTSAYTLDLTGREGFLSWAEVFGDDRPVEFEVGSGRAVSRECRDGPSRSQFPRRGTREKIRETGRGGALAKLELTNVRVYPGDAKHFSLSALGRRAWRRITFTFRTRGGRRGIKNAESSTRPSYHVARTSLIPDGDFWIATDVEEYYGVITSLVGDDPSFEPFPWPELKDPARSGLPDEFRTQIPDRRSADLNRDYYRRPVSRTNLAS